MYMYSLMRVSGIFYYIDVHVFHWVFPKRGPNKEDKIIVHTCLLGTREYTVSVDTI